MQTKYIPLALGALLLVLAGFFLPWRAAWEKAAERSATTTPAAHVDLSGITVGTLPSLEGTAAGFEAWSTFEAYVKAARAHDLPTIEKLSYRLSPACADEARRDECYGLMDSAVFFIGDFTRGDFTHVAFDDKQIVMSTDYIMLEGAKDVIKTVFYFVRTEGPQAKLAGVRFCVGTEVTEHQCVDTSSPTRDADDNGWWDDVEAFFDRS